MAVDLNDIRTIALGLPETTEEVTWGSDLTFRVRGKIFVITGDPATTASVKCSVEQQTELIAANPGTYAVAAYTGRFGWVRVDLSTVDPDELREVVVDAWRRTAPKRLVAVSDL